MDKMMSTLRGRVSTNLNELVQWTDSPFTAHVTSFPLPAKFRMPQVEAYDGSWDPLDHLESFKTFVHLQGLPYHTEGASKDMVQQTYLEHCLNLQGVEWALCHTLH